MKNGNSFFNNFAAYYRSGMMIPEGEAQKLSFLRGVLVFICYFAMVIFGSVGTGGDIYQDFDMLFVMPMCVLTVCKIYTLSVHERLVPMSHRRRVLCSLLFFFMWLIIVSSVWCFLVVLYSLLNCRLPDFSVLGGAGGFLLVSVFLYSTGFALLYTNLTAKVAKLPVIIAAFAVWAGLYAAIYIFGNVLNGIDFIYGGIFAAAGCTPLGWVFAALPMSHRRRTAYYLLRPLIIAAIVCICALVLFWLVAICIAIVQKLAGEIPSVDVEMPEVPVYSLCPAAYLWFYSSAVFCFFAVLFIAALPPQTTLCAICRAFVLLSVELYSLQSHTV